MTEPERSNGAPEGSGSIRQGARFGDLTLVRELGRGSQGIVYEAHQESLNRTVAVKILPKDISFTDDQSERFRREAEAAGRLSHPNVVAVYGLTESHGHLLISQELVTGGSLEDAVEERTKDGHNTTLADCAWAAGMCKQLAEGLAHAHAHGIVHRDIKPGNSLLNENGVPKITDFGLAKVDDKLGLSKTGTLMGTPHYMSPEQVQAVKDTVGPASDIYSLGAVLYRMLTGSVPFSGDSLQKVFLDILTRAPPSPRKLQPGVSADLEAVCLKALEKDPADRYGSAQEFADDLDRYLKGQPTLARPVGPVGKLARSLRRLATSTLAVVALLVPTLWVAVDQLQLQRVAERDPDVHFWRLGLLGVCTLLLVWPLALLGVRFAKGRALGALPAWLLVLLLSTGAGWGIWQQRLTQLHMTARAELTARLDLEAVGANRTVDDLDTYVAAWQERFDAEDDRLVARGFLKRERPTRAEDWAQRAEAAAPEDPVTHAVLLATFHALGRDADAERAEQAMTTLAEQQKAWRAWQQVGDILFDMKRFDSAREAYMQASYRPDVDRDLMTLKLARVSFELCDLAEAEDSLRAYIKYKPKDVSANVLAFNIARERNSHEAMAKHLEVIAKSPDAPVSTVLLISYAYNADTEAKQVNLDELARVLADADVDATTLWWWSNQALTLGLAAKGDRDDATARQRFEQAETGFGALLARDDGSLVAQLGLGAVELQLARFEAGAARLARLDRAIQHSTNATEIDPSYAEAHYNLGLAKLSRAWEEAHVYDLPLSKYAEKLAAVPVAAEQEYVDHVADALACNGLNSEMLNDTAWVLGQMYDRTGERELLNRGRQYAERAVKLKQAGRTRGECEPVLADERNLGMSYDTLAELQEKADDPTAALASEQAALASEPDQQGPYADYYRTRIEQLQAKVDG